MTRALRAKTGLMLAGFAGSLAAPFAAYAAEGGMPQLNPHDFAPQLVWLAIFFAAFYVIVSRIALPGIEGVLHARQSKLDGDLSAAAKLKDEAASALKAYETALADARAKAQKTIAEQSATLAANADAHKKSVEADLNAKLAAAAEEIRQKRAAALANVQSLSTDIASDIVARLTGQMPDAGRVAQAVEAVGAHKEIV